MKKTSLQKSVKGGSPNRSPLFIIVPIILSLLSCSKVADIITGGIDRYYVGPLLVSGRILTAASGDSPLSRCYDHFGRSFAFTPGDSIRIRFYDLRFEKSFEYTSTTILTMNDLFAEISRATAEAGATISVSFDSTGDGSLVTTASGTAIQSLIVENPSSPISMSVIPQCIIWPGAVTTGTRSTGRCFVAAESGSLLLTLRDSSAQPLGLEQGDIIRFSGRGPSGFFPVQPEMVIDSSRQTVGNLLSTLEALFPEGHTAIGNPSIDREAGRIMIRIDGGEYKLGVDVKDMSGTTIAPVRFIRTFSFHRDSTGGTETGAKEK